MSRKMLYAALSGILTVGVLASCGETDSEEEPPPEEDPMGEDMEEGDM
ncbi:hypothetical protein ATL39_2470 [Sinobaca qinghaiensis]|uniref:Uncharacterized protein n=1 Tax=Sinobaca qinghaiensis TaxID=342944 RepID=A0A419UZF8_9BACL|nr:hypothetical protein [Sinobaca qinghaiensis]RKD71080.1 hypothetical protein ATL39_2470 [Sinobaca qinghaiensis]